jgi:flagellar biosynthesis/type III secretory pathway chaperone
VSITSGMLQQVLDVLLAEEKELGALITLALEEQQALLESDFPRLTEVSARMFEVSGTVESLETSRLNLLRTAGIEDLTIEELLPLADDLGVNGFAETRLRMAASAQELRDAQENNARLLLNAMKLRDRWSNLFGGFVSPTYGAHGQRSARDGSGFVSRSA